MSHAKMLASRRKRQTTKKQLARTAKEEKRVRKATVEAGGAKKLKKGAS